MDGYDKTERLGLNIITGDTIFDEQAVMENYTILESNVGGGGIGANLISGTSYGYGGYIESTRDTASVVIGDELTPTGVYAGDEATLSFVLDLDNVTLNDKMTLSLTGVSKEGGLVTVFDNIPVKASVNYLSSFTVLFAYTGRLSDTFGVLHSLQFNFKNHNTGRFRVKQVKFEQGDTSTSWIPHASDTAWNIGDIKSKIAKHDADIKRELNKLSSDISNNIGTDIESINRALTELSVKIDESQRTVISEISAVINKDFEQIGQGFQTMSGAITGMFSDINKHMDRQDAVLKTIASNIDVNNRRYEALLKADATITNGGER